MPSNYSDIIVPLLSALLGSVLYPLVSHFLAQRANARTTRNAAAGEQLHKLYGTLYDTFQNSLPPDETLDQMPLSAQEAIVELVNRNRVLAHPALEESVRSIEESAWHGARDVDAQELGKIWRHVDRTYNSLRKQLGYHHRPDWLHMLLTQIWRGFRAWWWTRKWERQMKQLKSRKPRSHEAEDE